MDLEATALINKPTKRRTIAERLTAYGYKRLAFDVLIFVIKLAVLIGLAELFAYGMYKNPENILKFILMLIIMFTIVFMTKYCGLLFRCGCTWSFAGGASKCNIHNAEGKDTDKHNIIIHYDHDVSSYSMWIRRRSRSWML